MQELNIMVDDPPVVDAALADYRLTTAEIFYHLPDYPDMVQTYVWQELDRLPDFPKLHNFLGLWEREIDGKLHSIRVAYVDIIRPGEWLDTSVGNDIPV